MGFEQFVRGSHFHEHFGNSFFSVCDIQFRQNFKKIFLIEID